MRLPVEAVGPLVVVVQAPELVSAFLGANFSGEPRHVRRLNKRWYQIAKAEGAGPG